MKMLDENDIKMLIEVKKGTQGCNVMSQKVGIASVHIIEHRKKLEDLGLLEISKKPLKKGRKRIFLLTKKGKRILNLSLIIKHELNRK